MTRLADGTRFFGRLGEVAHDFAEDRVQCHLCGRWLKVVGGTHIRWHGWTLERYREAFQLRESVPTCSTSVSGRLRRSARDRIGQNGFAVGHVPRVGV
jgi:ROS/MUCR transcriptional regulator protein